MIVCGILLLVNALFIMFFFFFFLGFAVLLFVFL